ncbi:MAG: hypothetical protein ABFD18_11050 [Syntrophomonas sp.]
MAILLKTLSFSLWLLIMLAVIIACRRNRRRNIKKAKFYLAEAEDTKTSPGRKCFHKFQWDSLLREIYS